MVEENIPNAISHMELFITMKLKNNFCNRYQYKMQKSQDEGGNKAYEIFASQVEEGSSPNIISYVELFMTTMKMKNNFCNGRQYEMQKSRDGGGNNAYTIFTNRVMERNIPNTVSHMELLMDTMKMKNNFCNGYQYETQKS